MLFFVPSICIVSSSSPGILLRNRVSTRSATRSMCVYVGRLVECGPVRSKDDEEVANWMWIEPMRLEASFGQKRGEVYEARPSTKGSWNESASVNVKQDGFCHRP